jgi:hypothetical protein
MILLKPEYFSESDEDWTRRYTEGLCWTTRGLIGLREYNVNPFHVTIHNDDRKEDILVIYNITYDYLNKVHSFYFEDDYEECFKTYRQLIENNEKVKLYCSFLKKPNKNSSAIETWRFYGNEQSLYSWSDRFNAWQV